MTTPATTTNTAHLDWQHVTLAAPTAAAAASAYPHIHNFRLRNATGQCYGRAPAQRGKVLIVGGAFVDVTLALEEMPEIGGDSYAQELKVGMGGCAMNVANIMLQEKIPLDLQVPLGAGPYAQLVAKQLAADGYEPLVVDPTYDCAYCLCFVDKHGERTFIAVPGVENHMQAQWFDKVSLEQADLIYIAGFDVTEGNGELYFSHYAHKQPHTQIFFDAGPRVHFMTKESLAALLALQPILHLNRLELRLITGITDPEEALCSLEQRCAGPIILSLDAEGCLVSFQGERVLFPVQREPVVDATGAGDAHSSGIIAALLTGASLDEAIAYGHSLAVQAIAQIGARIQLPAELLIPTA